MTYLLIITRPDTIYIIKILTEFLQNPDFNYYAAASKYFDYFYNIRFLILELSFLKLISSKILTANNAVFTDNSVIRRSTKEVIFQLFNNTID